MYSPPPSVGKLVLIRSIWYGSIIISRETSAHSKFGLA